MWARVVEFMLACWLSLSPFIFRYPTGETFFWVSDFSAAVFLASFSLISLYRPLRKMHLCNLGVAGYLIGLSYYLQESLMYSALQNAMVLGLLILMLALLPTEANLPPTGWRDFYRKNG